jgi:hypothetical protein
MNVHPKGTWPATVEGLERFVKSFEDGTWPKRDWNHAAHVAAAAYLYRHCPREALARLRCGITAYNEGQGIEKSGATEYPESLTVGCIS